MSHPRSHNSRPRLFRRLRAVAVLVTTSLSAATGLVAAASIASSPAGAAPVTLVVTGDDASRNTAAPGAWTWDGDMFDELKDLIDNGSFGDAEFDLGTPVTTVTDAALANVDVYFASAVSGGYSASEQAALLRFVRRGGVLIANTNSGVPDYDVTDFLGATVEAVPSWYAASPDPNQCDEVATTGCIAEASAPVDATPVGSSPLLQGVSGIRNWHMFTYFTSLPSEAQELFRYSFTCTSAQPQACEAGTSYNNNVPSPLPVVALIPFGTAAFGNGAVLLTSDSDTFSDDALGNSSGNDTLAENFFNYVAGNLSQGFTPMTPTRILDTRNGIGAPTAKVAAASEVSVQVTGVAGIPNDATAVALNVTATNQEGAGFLTVYPNGRTRPNTSNLNIPPGLVDTANAVVVQIGDGGKVNIWNENNPTDIVVDVTGYWSPSGEGLVTATTPERILDTRNNIGTTGGALGEGETRTVQVHGEGGVPNDATAVILNVTATEGTRGGFLTVHDTATVPNASNVNFQANTNRPNLVFAVISSSGTVNVTNAFGQTHVIFDVMGYVTPSSGSVLSPVGPIRILDSRNGTGTTAGKVASNATIEMTVNGDTTAPEGASAVLINLTVDAPDAAGFLTAHPDASVPNASNVNFAPSQTVPNLVLARVGSDGNVRITNTSPGTSNIIADVFASFPSS